MFSNEIETTFRPAIEMLRQVISSEAFYGKGASTGLGVVMIDNGTLITDSLDTEKTFSTYTRSKESINLD